MIVDIYSFGGSKICSVKAKDTSYRIAQIMNEEFVQLDFTLTSFVEINQYAKIEWQGEWFYLADTPSITKANETQFDYSCKFVGAVLLMKNIVYTYLPLASDGTIKTDDPTYSTTKFSQTAKASEFLKMLCNNLQRLGIGEWRVGGLPMYDTEQTLTYDYTNCYDALDSLASTYNTEWSVVVGGETRDHRPIYYVNLIAQGYDEQAPLELSYGRGNGVLPNIKRSLHSEGSSCTHILVQGGAQNIQTIGQNANSAKYPYKELHLPHIPEWYWKGGGQNNRGLNNPNLGTDYPSYIAPDEEADKLVPNSILFDPTCGCFIGEVRTINGTTYQASNIYQLLRFVVDRNTNTLCWVNNAEPWLASPKKEVKIDLTSIYPQRVGKVTAVDANDPLVFFDSTNNVDYSKYFIRGEVATIIFQSGMLSGREFKIKTDSNGGLIGFEMNGGVSKFTLVQEAVDGFAMPSTDFPISVGDTYAIFHIALPSEYVNNLGEPTSGANKMWAETAYNANMDANIPLSYEGAEWELLRYACMECYKRCVQKYNYTISIDSKWVIKGGYSNKMRVGQWVKFVDGDIADGYMTADGKKYSESSKNNFNKYRFELWNKMRITAVKTFLNKPNHPEITLGEPAQKGVLQTLKELKSGVTASTIAMVKQKEETDSKIEETKKETDAKVENVTQQIQIIQNITSSGGTNGKLPIWIDGIEIYREVVRSPAPFNRVISDNLVVKTNKGDGRGNIISMGKLRLLNGGSNMLTSVARHTNGDIHPTYTAIQARWDFEGFKSKIPHGEYDYKPKKWYIYASIMDLRAMGVADLPDDYIPTLAISASYGEELSILEGLKGFKREVGCDLIAILDESDTLQEFYFTNGFEYLSPSTMPTSRIESTDGANYFDLENGKIKGDLWVDVEGEEVRVTDLAGNPKAIEEGEIRRLFAIY